MGITFLISLLPCLAKPERNKGIARQAQHFNLPFKVV